MGEQNVKSVDPQQLRSFMKVLLNDVCAFGKILESDMLESGTRRIGAEQELFLVDAAGRPAPVATEILSKIEDPHYTTELARFNLEINLDPLAFQGDCLKVMEQNLDKYVAEARRVAKEINSQVILIGILPTLRKTDLELSNMTPNPRYFALNDALCGLRGSAYQFHIEGFDELIIKHSSIMLESCNTSFQIHFQVSPHEFANLYNLAQLMTAPVLAVATNAPLLFGRRLWKETRIALFQQSIDTRRVDHQLRERQARVSFGNKWLEKSPLEIVQEDIARFRVLLGADLDENPFEKIEKGEAPELKAIKLHGGTVYHWNRMCYGISAGNKAHLRIENRVLPSGPTVLDEVANSAFFFGLMSAGASVYEDIRKIMKFDDARDNFLTASRRGLNTQFAWIDGKTYPVHDLVLSELLPMAREGLKKSQIDTGDIDRYLGVIEERVKVGAAGSSWLLNSFESMRKKVSDEQALLSLVSSTIENQIQGDPIHKWQPAQIKKMGVWKESHLKISELMTQDLFTVSGEELVDLVARLMDWQKLRHVLVEDDKSTLIGVISYRAILRDFIHKVHNGDEELKSAFEIMSKAPISIPPETTTLEAISILRKHRISCLPVVKEGTLTGIVSERDFSNIAGPLVEERMQQYQNWGQETIARKKDEDQEWRQKFLYVRDIMAADLITISPQDTLDLAAEKMVKHHILQIPVLDSKQKLLGIISYRSIIRQFCLGNTTVEKVMKKTITLEPDSYGRDAISLMRSKKVGCLPVVENGKMVGIVTERDFSDISAFLLEENLRHR